MDEAQKQAKRVERLNRVAGILEERGRSYGSAEPLFRMLAKRWSSLTGVVIDPSTVAMMMIDLKICRAANKAVSQDTIDDIIGYAVLLGELADE